ncbi:hypothetical protein NDU88_000989 [Pleurodeles waltl]|uniref:Uncharacterized protein n=1 Tax=Pleurodeles waltl TaxID=8319 RepID=A0AAV7SY28_PLEWA|nr:hypothetical protein NDU88_000989 [Pleurodeles waltl]
MWNHVGASPWQAEQCGTTWEPANGKQSNVEPRGSQPMVSKAMWNPGKPANGKQSNVEPCGSQPMVSRAMWNPGNPANGKQSNVEPRGSQPMPLILLVEGRDEEEEEGCKISEEKEIEEESKEVEGLLSSEEGTGLSWVKMELPPGPSLEESFITIFVSKGKEERQI